LSREWENLTETLTGERVVLEPLRPEHAEGLFAAAQATEIWDWLEHIGESRAHFDTWMEATLAASAAGEEGAFAVRDRGTGSLVGSSRYLGVRPAHRGVEIGWTWFNPSVWRTGANSETKLLLLRHAFETLGCIRVELKTDARNQRSRAAIGALPAQFEGIFRKHMIVPDVGLRDTAYFSIVDDEWPAVRAELERRLAARQPS
jgi:N-acetyltransferase